MRLHNDGAPPRAHTYPVPHAYDLDDSDRNVLAELAHEGCERHCEICGTCDWRWTGPETTVDVAGMEIGDRWYCQDCIPDTWRPDAAGDGFNPGPELAVSHDGITLTIQRSHLHDDRAEYYWQILTEGTLVPLVDGALICRDVTMPLTRVAGLLAWHWYRTAMPDTLALWGWPAIDIYPATTRVPDADQRAILHAIHTEGLA